MGRDALLLVDRSGRVVEGNDEAVRRFGRVTGRRCSDVVGLRVSGRTVCTAACVERRFEAGRPSRARGDVRGCTAHVTCSPLDGFLVVAVEPSCATLDRAESLTAREAQVLALVARGLTTPAIGEQLGISFATARTHLEHVRQKLGARTRAEAVARAAALGWVDLAAQP